MVQTIAVLAVLAVLAHKVAKAHALQVRAENKAIQSTFEALQERKEYAQEAQAQDAEIYRLAVKIAKR